MYQILKNLKNIKYKTEITKSKIVKYVKLEEVKC